MLWRDVLLIAWGCGCALTDCKYRRIPNALTFGAASVAIFYLAINGHSILDASPASAVSAGIGAIIVFAPMLWRRWLGAGDIKMMSAIGFIGGVEILTITFIFSSFLTLPVILWLWLKATINQHPSRMKNVKLPQGLFIALGLFLSLLSTPGVSHAQ